LWLELLREMTEDARVARFETPVLQPDGSVKETEVVPVGSFTAVGDGRYLSYLPGSKSLAVMARQPPQVGIMASARALLAAPPGDHYVPAVVDPARGSLLALVVDRPDFLERIAEGEVVGYLIIGVGIIGVLVALFQYIYLIVARI